MMRRPMWLAAGAALGAGGTVWAQRRLQRLTRRVRPTAVANQLVSRAERTRRTAADKVRDALDTGRSEARRRQDDLWRDLDSRRGAAR